MAPDISLLHELIGFHLWCLLSQQGLVETSAEQLVPSLKSLESKVVPGRDWCDGFQILLRLPWQMHTHTPDTFHPIVFFMQQQEQQQQCLPCRERSLCFGRPGSHYLAVR